MLQKIKDTIERNKEIMLNFGNDTDIIDFDLENIIILPSTDLQKHKSMRENISYINPVMKKIRRDIQEKL